MTTASRLPRAVSLGCFLVLFQGTWAAEPEPGKSAQGGKPREPRAAWTTSRVFGSPEPPPPFRSERAFPKLTFKNPLLITTVPGRRRFAVGEHAGKVFTFRDDPNVSQKDLLLDLTADLKTVPKDGSVAGLDAVYGLAFHPKFAENRFCYVCYVLQGKDGKQLPDGSRLSRFTVTATDPPRCDPASEVILLTFLGGGHNGGDLAFGNDGFLYLSTGDGSGPNPPDSRNTGQDLTDLLSSILRIDVDRADPGRNYAVPADNPFVKLPGARPEIWAYGLRNPWRMSIDRPTGELWVGDVGWELWEMVYRIEKGGNYGWSVTEGRQPVKPNGKRGPTPILPPYVDFPHTEAASITGGFVYRGTKLKGLAGRYVCGDWATRKVWSVTTDRKTPPVVTEIARTTERVVAFGEGDDHELYYLNYDENGGVYRLIPNDAPSASTPFPRKLSETGLFRSVEDHRLAPGVYPFAVNVALWQDGAHTGSDLDGGRFIALPGTGTVIMHDDPVPFLDTMFSTRAVFPKDTVLGRTVSHDLLRGKDTRRGPRETQLLHFDGREWHGYSYLWNNDNTDAELVGAAGLDRTLTFPHADGPLTKTVRVHSRAECLRCHNPWAGPELAFTLPQLNRKADGREQLVTFQKLGLIAHAKTKPGDEATLPSRVPSFAEKSDSSASLEQRARSYLHVNCAHCHQFGAGGTTLIDLRFDRPLEAAKTIDAVPTQGTLTIPDGRIIAPGDPFRSVLYYRMAKQGAGRMPHIGSELVDPSGLDLIHDWIRAMPPHQREHGMLARVRAGGKDAQAIDGLLTTPTGAMMLARALGESTFPDAARRFVIDIVTNRPEPHVRDLFERYLPESKRVKRLGTSIKPEAVLAVKGDPGRGKALFFGSSVMQCKSCHAVERVGGTLGPELTHIGKKLDRAKLLESILEPSKIIDPPFVAYVIETEQGKLYTGLIAEKTAETVVLKLVGDQTVTLPLKQIASMTPTKTSLMPEQLFRDLTAQEAADLIAYLEGLK